MMVIETGFFLLIRSRYFLICSLLVEEVIPLSEAEVIFKHGVIRDDGAEWRIV